jgi:hypothetical protein
MLCRSLLLSRVNDVRCCLNLKTHRIDVCPTFEWPVLTQASCTAEALNTCRTQILVWLAPGNGKFVARPCRRDQMCRRILELNSPPSAQMRMTAGYVLMIRPRSKKRDQSPSCLKVKSTAMLASGSRSSTTAYLPNFNCPHHQPRSSTRVTNWRV